MLIVVQLLALLQQQLVLVLVLLFAVVLLLKAYRGPRTLTASRTHCTANAPGCRQGKFSPSSLNTKFSAKISLPEITPAPPSVQHENSRRPTASRQSRTKSAAQQPRISSRSSADTLTSARQHHNKQQQSYPLQDLTLVAHVHKLQLHAVPRLHKRRSGRLLLLLLAQLPVRGSHARLKLFLQPRLLELRILQLLAYFLKLGICSRKALEALKARSLGAAQPFLQTAYVDIPLLHLRTRGTRGMPGSGQCGGVGVPVGAAGSTQSVVLCGGAPPGSGGGCAVCLLLAVGAPAAGGPSSVGDRGMPVHYCLALQLLPPWRPFPCHH